jgi:transcriptional regulator with XRE-family HTH domain
MNKYTSRTMRKDNDRKKAVLLRQQGYSLNEIAKKLLISKSTASLWLRNITLDKNAKLRLGQRTKAKSLNGLMSYSKKLRDNKIKQIKHDEGEGKKLLGKLSKRDIFCIGIGLYWGEGYKRGSQEFGFTNSDPVMVKFYIMWLNVVFGVNKKDLILRISINVSHQKRIAEVERFWTHTTGMSLSQFTKTSFIKASSNKKYANPSSHMGTLRIKVKNGTRMRRMVIGAIKSVDI